MIDIRATASPVAYAKADSQELITKYQEERRSFLRSRSRSTSLPVLLGAGLLLWNITAQSGAQQSKTESRNPNKPQRILADSRLAQGNSIQVISSPQYRQIQQRLAQGWNTWDVQSVTSHVLLPDGLAIRVGLEHNTSELVDSFLATPLIGRLERGAEQVFPGPHAWDGSYTDLRLTWRHNALRIQSAHDGDGLVILATPLGSEPNTSMPPTIVFSVSYLWNRPGIVTRHWGDIEARNAERNVEIYCAQSPPVTPGEETESEKPCSEDIDVNIPITGPYFAMDFRSPVGVSTGKARTVAEIEAIIDRARQSYEKSLTSEGKRAPIADTIETTIGWDTIYDPETSRVITPVSRGWCTGWGGAVLFEWDTFFAASLAAVGDRDLAYANAIEVLNRETPEGFVPNYARSGGWKSFDRSEPPVGSITVLGLYRKFHDRWFLEDTFEPLLRWNRWWAEHRDIDGYLTWGSDGENRPANVDDSSSGTRTGAILESGLDNSPMYDDVTYDEKTHLLESADVGLMSLYIADCDALAQIANELGKTAEAKELETRSQRYRTKLATLWDDRTGIFLNKDLKTNKSNLRLSPTNFYPLLAKAATPEQAKRMINEHLLNSAEFWGKWVIPSIARNDGAFFDQKYWRGRIWGPMNYLVYLGLRNYDDSRVTEEFAQKSYQLFEQEWKANGHVHENYNAVTGMGDDVNSSDRFYHWGALLALIEYMQESQVETAGK
jgi:Mannosylglycerate hydrolase MGH1-like glycoside hydrolase domain